MKILASNLKSSHDLSHIKFFVGVWRKRNFLDSIIFLSASIACFIFLFLFAKFSEPHPWEPIATKPNGQIDFAQEFAPVILGGGMILLFVTFLIKFIKALFPPTKNRSIEKTVKTFFNSAFDGVQVNSWGTLDSSIKPKDVGAMFVISSAAFEKIGGWSGFVDSWSKHRSNLQKELSGIFAANIKKINVSIEDNSNVIKKVGVDLPFLTQKNIYIFSTVLEIEKINNKWFLTFADFDFNIALEK